MRILIIHNFYNPNINSGENEVVRNEYSLLKEAGHSVTLFSEVNEPDNALSWDEKLSIGVKFISGMGVSSKLRVILETENFDVCHIHNIFPLIGSHVIEILYNAGIPIVHTLHNYRYRCGNGINMRNETPCYKCSRKLSQTSLVIHSCYRNSALQSSGMYFAKRAYTNQFQRISKFILLSEYSKKSLEDFGISTSRTVVKPNFSYSAQNLEKKYLKNLVFFSRLEEIKGIIKLLEAWDKSSISRQGWNLVIAGGGSLANYVEDISRANQSVRYLGLLNRESLQKVVAEARYSFFASSMDENCPMSIIESLAVGTPLIACPNNSTREFLNGNFALSMDTDLMSWIKLFNTLDSLDYQRMSAAAFKEYTQKYSPESSLEKLESIYKSSRESKEK